MKKKAENANLNGGKGNHLQFIDHSTVLLGATISLGGIHNVPLKIVFLIWRIFFIEITLKLIGFQLQKEFIITNKSYKIYPDFLIFFLQIFVCVFSFFLDFFKFWGELLYVLVDKCILLGAGEQPATTTQNLSFFSFRFVWICLPFFVLRIC